MTFGHIDLHQPSFVDGELDRAELQLFQRVEHSLDGPRRDAGVIAWLRWGETPDLSSLLGAALIFASSLLSIARRPTAR